MPHPKNETKNIKRNARVKVKKPLRPRRSKTTAPRRSSSTPSTGRIRNVVLPIFLSFCILVCLAALGFLGYQTVTASDFFNVANVELHGADRSSAADIRRIVEMQTEKSGVWNADLPGIKEKLERLQWVKSAAVSRVLPNGIRVQVFERVPQAAVRAENGTVLVDAEGLVIAPAKEKEATFPFVMTGWNDAKSEA